MRSLNPSDLYITDRKTEGKLAAVTNGMSLAEVQGIMGEDLGKLIHLTEATCPQALMSRHKARGVRCLHEDGDGRHGRTQDANDLPVEWQGRRDDTVTMICRTNACRSDFGNRAERGFRSV